MLIVGAANLAADGLSMGVGNYLSIRANESAREADNLPEEESSPARHGLATFLAFALAGGLPRLPYMLAFPATIRDISSAVLAMAGLFGVGAIRTTVTAGAWWKVGLEVLILGGIVGAAAYGAGAIVATIIGEELPQISESWCATGFRSQTSRATCSRRASACSNAVSGGPTLRAPALPRPCPTWK